jgi:hypothetical protein
MPEKMLAAAGSRPSISLHNFTPSHFAAARFVFSGSAADNIHFFDQTTTVR